MLRDPDRPNQISAVTVDVTIGTPVPTPMPTPTGSAIWPRLKRPEAMPTRPSASEMIVMILPPEPSRNAVNFVNAVSKVVSVPAKAGPARTTNARKATGDIRRSDGAGALPALGGDAFGRHQRAVDIMREHPRNAGPCNDNFHGLSPQATSRIGGVSGSER